MTPTTNIITCYSHYENNTLSSTNPEDLKESMMDDRLWTSLNPDAQHSSAKKPKWLSQALDYFADSNLNAYDLPDTAPFDLSPPVSSCLQDSFFPLSEGSDEDRPNNLVKKRHFSFPAEDINDNPQKKLSIGVVGPVDEHDISIPQAQSFPSLKISLEQVEETQSFMTNLLTQTLQTRVTQDEIAEKIANDCLSKISDISNQIRECSKIHQQNASFPNLINKVSVTYAKRISAAMDQLSTISSETGTIRIAELHNEAATMAAESLGFLSQYTPEFFDKTSSSNIRQVHRPIHQTQSNQDKILVKNAMGSSSIPNVFQNLVSGNAGASGLQSTKQTMCEHMVDGGDCKNGDAGAASNQILNHVRYNTSMKHKSIAQIENEEEKKSIKNARACFFKITKTHREIRKLITTNQNRGTFPRLVKKVSVQRANRIISAMDQLSIISSETETGAEIIAELQEKAANLAAESLEFLSQFYPNHVDWLNLSLEYKQINDKSGN